MVWLESHLISKPPALAQNRSTGPTLGNEDGSVQIVFNGEVCNFQRLGGPWRGR